MKNPFQLDSGLYLEDSNLLLPWTGDRGFFAKSSDYWQNRNGATLFAWNNRVFFNGLNGNIYATIDDECEKGNPNFNLGVTFKANSLKSIKMLYEKTQELLVERFGTPEFQNTNDDSATTKWFLNSITINHEYWDGFGGDHYISVSCKQFVK